MASARHLLIMTRVLVMLATDRRLRSGSFDLGAIGVEIIAIRLASKFALEKILGRLGRQWRRLRRIFGFLRDRGRTRCGRRGWRWTFLTFTNRLAGFVVGRPPPSTSVSVMIGGVFGPQWGQLDGVGIRGHWPGGVNEVDRLDGMNGHCHFLLVDQEAAPFIDVRLVNSGSVAASPTATGRGHFRHAGRCQW